MNFNIRLIDPELAPEMTWQDFVNACFTLRDVPGSRRRIPSCKCFICGYRELFSEKQNYDERAGEFVSRGWRYDRVHEGIIVKCKECVRKATDRYRRYV